MVTLFLVKTPLKFWFDNATDTIFSPVLRQIFRKVDTFCSFCRTLNCPWKLPFWTLWIILLIYYTISLLKLLSHIEFKSTYLVKLFWICCTLKIVQKFLCFWFLTISLMFGRRHIKQTFLTCIKINTNLWGRKQIFYSATLINWCFGCLLRKLCSLFLFLAEFSRPLFNLRWRR